MNILYHSILCPFSRQVRFYLKELNIDFILKDLESNVPEQKIVQPSLQIVSPVLYLEKLKFPIYGIYPIIEYLNDTNSDFFFMHQDIFFKSEIRRYISLFNVGLYQDVIQIYIYEKIFKFLQNKGTPNTILLKKAINNLIKYLEMISHILSSKIFLIYERISCADIAVASHISILDYFNSIDWDRWRSIAYWYSLIKSQKGFQAILKDKIPGFLPSSNYAKLDFVN